jgi:signal transduction histidine kinase
MKTEGNLKEAHQLIEKFIYSCSHDLRGPLSSIQGLVRIAEYYPHHEETSKCLEMIEACTVKMGKLIHALEEYMIIEQRDLKAEEVDGTELIDQVVTDFEDQLSERSINIIKEVEVNKPLITDSHSVRQIINHLFSNAILFSDYTKSDRQITVRIKASDENSTIEIVDNGLGITEKDKSKIFDIFYRGSMQSEGFGMGLFLVNHLIKKIGAKLSFNSYEKIGTCFKVSIPNNSYSQVHVFPDLL